MEVVEESAYTPEQLLGYDKFWDIIRTENTLYNSGVRQGRAEGEQAKALNIALNLKSMGLGIADIQKATGLSEEEIRDL